MAVLAATGVLPRWPGLIHLVALPPLDLIADLRILMVVSPSHPVFVAGLALSLAVRVTVLALLLGGLDRRRLGYAIRFYLVVLPPALIAAALLLGAGATLYFGLFWMGLVAALTTVAVTATAGWSTPPRLAAGFAAAVRHGLRLGTVGAYVVVLAALGAIADLTGPTGAVVLVPVSALLTLTAARLLRMDPPLRPEPSPRVRWSAVGLRLTRRAIAGVGAAAVAALVVVMVTGPTGPPRAPEPDTPRRGSLMLMSGVDSSSGNGAILEIDPHFSGYTCEQTYYFSYAGPGRGQPRNAALCPITTGAPYQAADTLRSTNELVDALEAQLAGLPPPVVLVTHSQGVWITWEAALRDRLPNVGALVLIGPFPENPVPYPPRGKQGVSRLAADVTWLISRWSRPGGTSVFTPDSPLSREWLAHPTAIAETLAGRPPPDIRVLSVPSVFDTPLMPAGPSLRWATDLCSIPVIHPNVPYSAEFQRSLTRFLDHEPQSPCPLWRRAVGPLFRPFSVPTWDA
ncbi:hypothetical protein [Streptomyces gobiensis]|uniref:hypothetical protein n=1 Tax=Streptomyces gobiensis TaxID=2875706 RepID=UPI001E3AB17A|nr:hypothetical protein [Streptomyces gobiensis]UGY94618.1 hypothetical protein test1122_24715 [Streptomyces gobiensis]